MRLFSRMPAFLLAGVMVVGAGFVVGCKDKADDKKMSDMTKVDPNSLYARLGGEPAIKAVVDDFVARAAADPKVNFTRKNPPQPNQWDPTPENVAHLKMGLVNLIGQLTGGPQKYTGKSMLAAHKGMNVTEDEFNALAGDLIASLDKFKVPQKEKDELIKIVASTKGDIVGK